MKKTLSLIILSIFLLLTFAGCKDTEIQEGKSSSSDKSGGTSATVEVNVEELLGELDYSAEHMEADLTDKFSIAADIVPENVYTGEFGLYHYSIHERADGENFDEVKVNEAKKELAELVDLYFETDYVETGFYASMTNLYSDQDKTGWLYEGKSTDNYVARTLDVFFPVHIEGYRLDLIEQRAAEIAEMFQPFIMIENYSLECVWVCEEMYETMKNFAADSYGDISPVEDDGSGERFEVILRQTMDHGVVLSDVYGVSDYTNEVRIYLDSDYEVYAVEGRNEILMESEAFRQAELVPLKDIFLRFYEQYGHGKKKTITDVKLNYTILDDEETGDSCLAPCWAVTWYEEGKDVMWRCVYSALDGTLLFSYG
ncbi:MAG: hypothetical protein LUE29_06645 [Lachnospiraceae bacterium]|nr:hypothetical protein [Lachnospiraceae bacterium]